MYKLRVLRPNRYYERPATLGLLPEVREKTVLDAGCGAGAYTKILLERGARVVGIDLDPMMIQVARKRLGTAAELHQADISKPLSFFEARRFDVVLCPLVLGFIEELGPVFAEFYRILRSPGVFVFSDGHPFGEFARWSKAGQAKNYFAVEPVGDEWTGFGESPDPQSYRRPLGALLDPLLDSGFVLNQIVEPAPTPELQEGVPEYCEEMMREPGFICVRAYKD